MNADTAAPAEGKGPSLHTPSSEIKHARNERVLVHTVVDVNAWHLEGDESVVRCFDQGASRAEECLIGGVSIFDCF